MIKKQITMPDGTAYTIGFKEVGSSNELIECHVLERKLLGHTSIYCYSTLKGLSPNYSRIAFLTVSKYLDDLKRKEKMIDEVWSFKLEDE